MIKKKINSLFFIIFLLSFFLPTTLVFSGSLDDTSFESGAKEKKLGFEHKERDSSDVIKKKFIRDIEMGNIDNIKMFLKNNQNDINFISNGLNPFTHAANLNNLELLKLFLNETEIDIDITDELGNTALINASNKGHLEVVDFLINNGANINYQNKQGLTAAMKAAENNNFYVIKLLLDKNVDLTKSDFSGRTLKEIAENSRDKRILQLFN
tara:strand:+ start:882 stop:1514 length:633 start_codon:yes stop_codon:yes gene_type:complete